MITQATIFFLGPLALLMMLGGVRMRLFAIAFATCLVDAAAVTLGGTSVGMRWAVALLFMARFVLGSTIKPVSGRDLAMAITRILPLLIFFVWNLVLVAYAPYIFTNIEETMPGSSMMRWQNAVPLTQNPESFNQSVYFALAMIFVTFLAATLVSDRDKLEERCNFILSTTFICAAFWYIWHILSQNLGIYFPDALLHNDSHAMAWNQGVAGVRRPSGSFPEPSAAAAFFIPFLIYNFEQYLRREQWPYLVMWFTALLLLFLSTSTTAYFGIALFGAWVVARAIWGGASVSMGKAIRGRLLVTAAVFAAFAVVASAVAWTTFIDQEAAQNVFQTQVLDKAQSSSYAQRTYANSLALQLFMESYGVGIGMGNHRASSLLLAVMCGTGVIGVLLIVTFMLDVCLRALRWKSTDPTSPDGYGWAVGGALGALLCAMGVTTGELNSLTFWIWATVAVSLAMTAPARVSRRAAASYPAFDAQYRTVGLTSERSRT
ncbi:MAG: hypothetical protein MI723_16575 [Caulobacterales bacterium]|nr:hypothetical protein [Caulobacterales bacterium]